ncbi:MAG TPA: ABC transporter permease, partial [Chryseolinea sp.]|nr:ABC transporter permease [Chryseolinea sp.]
MIPNRSRPPKLASKLLLSFLRSDLTEEVLGDLEQKFYITLKTRSRFKAKVNYWYQVIHYVRPFAIRKLKPTPSNNIAMFQSYFKIGWRNLFKEKGYSFINIGGLAAGMAVAVIIGLWIYDELSFNKSHKNYDSIARVMYRASRNGETGHSNHMPFPLGQALSQNFQDDFKYVVTSTFTEGHIISNGDLKFTKPGKYMQRDAPEMLSLDMIRGTHDGLKDMNSIMLSESLTETLFGDEDPINKVVKIDNKADVKITGTYKDFPKNSEFRDVAFIAPMDLYLASNEWLKKYVDAWNSGNIEVLVQLAPHATLDDVSGKIKNVIHDNLPEGDKVYNIQTFLHPMKKWHLYEEFKDGRNAGGQIRFVWLFGTIGVFVLLLACINFMNLSTARSERRAKEVGIRKAIGSFRTQLMSQFFSESLLVVILSFILSIGIVLLTLPWFNGIANKEISMPWTNHFFWISCFLFVVMTGAIAGSYPALYLSSFQPVKVLKG